MTNECFYTVVIFDNARNRIDYEYPSQFSDVANAKSFIESHGEDYEFSLKILKYNFDDLSVEYL